MFSKKSTSLRNGYLVPNTMFGLIEIKSTSTPVHFPCAVLKNNSAPFETALALFDTALNLSCNAI